MSSFFLKLYGAIRGTYKFIIMLLVLIVLAGIGYGGYVVYQKAHGVFQTASKVLGIAKGIARDSYGRGAGIPLGCGPDEEMDGALCYPKCEADYNGVGPVCWQNCPEGFRDDGAFCGKPAPYGRGAGYPLWEEGKCNIEHAQHSQYRIDIEHAGFCEKSGALWYPKCRANFHAVGCCVCSPNCPEGMSDIGVSCAKRSSGRGAGAAIHACQDGYEKDGLLCYPVCKPNYKGVGPVCWEQI